MFVCIMIGLDGLIRYNHDKEIVFNFMTKKSSEFVLKKSRLENE